MNHREPEITTAPTPEAGSSPQPPQTKASTRADQRWGIERKTDSGEKTIQEHRLKVTAQTREVTQRGTETQEKSQQEPISVTKKKLHAPRRHKKEKKKEKERERKIDKERERSTSKKKKSKDKERDRERKSDGEKGDVKSVEGNGTARQAKVNGADDHHEEDMDVSD
ncbi:serine/arginine-rich splicing factor 11-like [Notothenia coriiceps]|uniref:Serine/arginine-rich splicing factor 11-like n=1 Tax=Notothenia coriiceps TaxID=8208 RepID=A0A6I9P0L6_9TELE|nr:PREDICTED: serine/arginine-rich splicing factor 11-like [Notothenia coriiceps]